MADITSVYGYKNQFTFYVENNGVNPITVTSVDLLNEEDVAINNIFTEIENTLPILVIGNSQLDIITNWYSLNNVDVTTDVTYQVNYNVVDLTDFTSVLDSTFVDVSFELINFNITDTTYYSLLSALNKHFKLGPNAPDTTFSTSGFTETGYPIVTFNNKLEFQLFSMRYQPQFALFNHVVSQTNLIVGSFYFNSANNSLECFFTEDEKTLINGMVFNNILMFYSQL